jgi:hypothetical protein
MRAMLDELRSQLTGKRLLRLVLLVIAIGIAAVLALGNNVGYGKTLRPAANGRTALTASLRR